MSAVSDQNKLQNSENSHSLRLLIIRQYSQLQSTTMTTSTNSPFWDQWFSRHKSLRVIYCYSYCFCTSTTNNFHSTTADLRGCIMQHVHVAGQLSLKLRHAVSIRTVSIIITQILQLFIRHVRKLGLQLLDLLIQQWRRLLLRHYELSDRDNQKHESNDRKRAIPSLYTKVCFLCKPSFIFLCITSVVINNEATDRK